MTVERGPKTRGDAAVTARLVRYLQASATPADTAPQVSRARAQAFRGDAARPQGLAGYERGRMLAMGLSRTGDRAQPKRATRSGDRKRRPPPTGALLARTQQQLAVLRDRELGRELGNCVRCGKPVRSQQDFIRHYGSVIHVRCHTPRPAPGALSAAPVPTAGGWRPHWVIPELVAHREIDRRHAK
jgi:uncharacterized C2H2 Zn-finger protein